MHSYSSFHILVSSNTVMSFGTALTQGLRIKSRFNNKLLTSMETEYKSMAILTDSRGGYSFYCKDKKHKF